MGRKSSIENPNKYLISRQNAELTRAQAAELSNLSESTIEKIEREAQKAHPSDIILMAKAYKDPSLCNYYCANECEIGKTSVPVLEIQDLSRIVLSMISKLNSIDCEKNRLIDIAADGTISDEEITDFVRIQSQLEELSISVEALKLWVKQTIADGNIDHLKIEAAKKSIK